MSIEGFFAHAAHEDRGQRLPYQVTLPEHPDKPVLYTDSREAAMFFARSVALHSGMLVMVYRQDEEANRWFDGYRGDTQVCPDGVTPL